MNQHAHRHAGTCIKISGAIAQWACSATLAMPIVDTKTQILATIPAEIKKSRRGAWKQPEEGTYVESIPIGLPMVSSDAR